MMRTSIIGFMVLLLSIFTASQWYGGGMGYGMGYGGGYGGGGLVPMPTYSYELPSNYGYTPSAVSLVGNTYTFTPPQSTFGAVTTYNVNQTSPQYLQPPPNYFGHTGWNQGFGFGGQGFGFGNMGYGHGNMGYGHGNMGYGHGNMGYGHGGFPASGYASYPRSHHQSHLGYPRSHHQSHLGGHRSMRRQYRPYGYGGGWNPNGYG